MKKILSVTEYALSLGKTRACVLLQIKQGRLKNAVATKVGNNYIIELIEEENG